MTDNKEWICAEVSTRDYTARAGQPVMYGRGLIVAQDADRLFVLPYEGNEFDPMLTRLQDMCNVSQNAGANPMDFIEHYSEERSVGGMTSVSDLFKINAEDYFDLIEKLIERGFNASREL